MKNDQCDEQKKIVLDNIAGALQSLKPGARFVTEALPGGLASPGAHLPKTGRGEISYFVKSDNASKRIRLRLLFHPLKNKFCIHTPIINDTNCYIDIRKKRL